MEIFLSSAQNSLKALQHKIKSHILILDHMMLHKMAADFVSDCFFSDFFSVALLASKHPHALPVTVDSLLFQVLL